MHAAEDKHHEPLCHLPLTPDSAQRPLLHQGGEYLRGQREVVGHCDVGRLAVHIPKGLFVPVSGLACWNGKGWARVSSYIHAQMLADLLMKEGQQCCGCCCSIFAELAVREFFGPACGLGAHM